MKFQDDRDYDVFENALMCFACVRTRCDYDVPSWCFGCGPNMGRVLKALNRKMEEDHRYKGPGAAKKNEYDGSGRPSFTSLVCAKGTDIPKDGWFKKIQALRGITLTPAQYKAYALREQEWCFDWAKANRPGR